MTPFPRDRSNYYIKPSLNDRVFNLPRLSQYLKAPHIRIMFRFIIIRGPTASISIRQLNQVDLSFAHAALWRSICTCIG